MQVEREGKDITITAFSKMVGYALKVLYQFFFAFHILVHPGELAQGVRADNFFLLGLLPMWNG
jgi:hypothetical protein